MRGVAVVVACCLATACATRVAKVDHHVILQPGAVQHELAALELFVMPMELEAPPPEFPAAYASGDLAPLVVCAEVWLDADGNIRRIAPLRSEARRVGKECVSTFSFRW